METIFTKLFQITIHWYTSLKFFICLIIVSIILGGYYFLKKKFLKRKKKENQIYFDAYGNKITKIDADVPTTIYSRGEGDDEEHVVVTKLKRLPKKIRYE